MVSDKTDRCVVLEARQHLSTETHDNRQKRSSYPSFVGLRVANQSGSAICSEAKVVNPPPDAATCSPFAGHRPWGLGRAPQCGSRFGNSPDFNRGPVKEEQAAQPSTWCRTGRTARVNNRAVTATCEMVSDFWASYMGRSHTRIRAVAWQDVLSSTAAGSCLRCGYGCAASTNWESPGVSTLSTEGIWRHREH